MATVRAEVIYDYAKNKRVQKFIRDFPKQFPKAVEKRLNKEVVTLLKQELQTEPRPAVLPFTFATEKSRRWYFANKVKGKRGGRYVRTHKFSKGWTVRIVVGDNAVALAITNPASFTRYVTGKRRVPGHIKTGWYKHEAIFGRHIKRAKKAAVAGIRDVLASRKGLS